MIGFDEQCVGVIYIQGRFGSDQSADDINREYRFWYLTGPQVWQYSSYQGGRMGQGKEVVASFQLKPEN